MSRTLIIGATSAIAEATARLLAARGDALYLVGRNETMLAAIAADLVVRGCPRIATESLDANDLAAHEAMLERAEGFLGARSLTRAEMLEAELDLRTEVSGPGLGGHQHQHESCPHAR